MMSQMKRIFIPIVFVAIAVAAEPPAIEAVRNGNLGALREAIKTGVNARGSRNQTALHEAVLACNVEAAQLLIDAGIDRSIRDNANRTASGIPIKCSNPADRDRLFRLVVISTQPGKSDESMPWSLQDAAAHGNVESLSMLLKMRGDVNAIGSKGNRALEIACRKGNVQVAKMLLDHGADVRLKTSSDTAILHEAAMGGNAEIIDLLIARGADIRAVDPDGSTPLHYAASFGRLDAVRALIRGRSDLNRKNNKGRAPIDEAIANQQDEVANLLRAASKAL